MASVEQDHERASPALHGVLLEKSRAVVVEFEVNALRTVGGREGKDRANFPLGDERHAGKINLLPVEQGGGKGERRGFGGNSFAVDPQVDGRLFRPAGAEQRGDKKQHERTMHDSS